MVHRIASALEAWRDDPGVHAVVLDAQGEGAFCAGGDIRAIRSLVLDGDYDAVDAFFIHEYALNRVIARYPKPYISLIDGTCMGGGVGLSAHGSIRVASEHARFAMPETLVGLFPDVGASFILPRLRGDYGMFLALTGARIGGADACYLGLATHYVPRERIAGLAAGLAEVGLAALTDVAIPPPCGAMPGLVDAVAAFAHPNVPAIMTALEQQDSDWARRTLAGMRAASPTALLWTHEIHRAGAHRTLEQCQRAELCLMRQAARHPDFAEGVRAMIVDKDRQPRWSPARLEDVDRDSIAEALRSSSHGSVE